MPHPSDCWCAYCEPETDETWDEELLNEVRRRRHMGVIRTSNPNALETKVIATVTTPGKRKTEEKEMQLIGVHVGGKRSIIITDETGRVIQIPVTDAVEAQLRCALRVKA